MSELGFAAIRSSLPGQYRPNKTLKPAKNKTNRQPYRRVYFVRHLDTGAIKIGKSANPERRLEALKETFGGRMELVGWIDSESAETTLHRLLDRWALGKEWFSPSKEVLAAMEECLKAGVASGIDLAHTYSFVD